MKIRRMLLGLLWACLIGFFSKCCADCMADGFRVLADGTLSEDYISVVLTNEQRKAAKEWHVINLTVNQFEKVKAVKASAFREIQIVPYGESGCT